MTEVSNIQLSDSADENTRRYEETQLEVQQHDPPELGIHGIVSFGMKAGNMIIKLVILCIVMLFFGTALFINFWMINLYHMHKNDLLPCSPNIVMWLHVSGASGFAGLAMAFLRSVIVAISTKIHDFMPPRTGTALNCLNQLNNLFGFIWLVYGSFMIYSMDRTNTTCPQDAVSFTFIFITVTWSVAGGAVTVALIAGFTALFLKYTRAKGYN